MDEKGRELTPDEVEERVLGELRKLNVAGLEAAGEVLGLDMEGIKGNKKELRKAITNFLWEKEEDDKTAHLELHKHLFPNVVKKEDVENEGKVELTDNEGNDGVFDDQKSLKTKTKDEKPKPHKQQTRRRSNTIDTVDITRV